MRVDPLVDQTQSPYGYAGDDPVNEDDPSGLITCGGWIPVGCGVVTDAQHGVSSGVGSATETIKIAGAVVGLGAVDAIGAILNHVGNVGYVADSVGLGCVAGAELGGTLGAFLDGAGAPPGAAIGCVFGGIVGGIYGVWTDDPRDYGLDPNTGVLTASVTPDNECDRSFQFT